MKHLIYIFTAVAVTSGAACSLIKPKNKKEAQPVAVADTVKKVAPEPEPMPEPTVYRASRTRINDILDTKLEVSFDYQKQWLLGKALLTITPYFKPAFYLDLDAKGMEIKKVEVVADSGRKALKYEYDGSILRIALNRVYKKDEKYKVFIEYIAKPNELKSTEGSAAITSAKGLYFINPEGKEANKPTQIWTQGETQASSCWFPTIDSPNEKMTQEIAMTVPKKYITLSNGLLISSVDNKDNTRTDTWKQSLPHSPYLAMMAVGDFAVVKDKWRNLEVNYYVERAYEENARNIFGNTPQMMEFFSNKLGVDYAWEKYSQIVVRDYVSGAMENTSATLHGEFLQQTERELLDGDNEEVISHELFHQWFGDLVTAESWSNLSLNESFATYGEYLWNEFKYGRDAADYSLNNDLKNYIQQAASKREVDLIRFDFEDKEDMFDAVSYQKGGRILHMLRKYLGDDAFFTGLKKYLNDNRFRAAEVHNLRLAFEDVSGEDLNWFFNQWYLNHGHPELAISHKYVDSLKKEIVTIEQKQNFKENPLYKLPIRIDIYHSGKVESHSVTINKASETFEFGVAGPADLINVDAEKMLLCTKTDTKELKEWIFMYFNAPLFMDRHEALTKIAASSANNTEAQKAIIEAMSDKFWNIRLLAVKNAKKAAEFNKGITRDKLISIAQNDTKTSVRAEAIKALTANFPDEPQTKEIIQQSVTSRSYLVMGEALTAMGKTNKEEALRIAKDMESDDNDGTKEALMNLYAEIGTDANNVYYTEALKNASGAGAYQSLQVYGRFLNRSSDETVSKSLYTIENIARTGSPWFVKLGAMQVLSTISQRYEKQTRNLDDELAALKTENKSPEAIALKEAERNAANTRKENLTKLMNSIKADEKDENVLKYYGRDSK